VSKSNTERRKKEHLKIALSDEAQIGSAGFEKYRFVHNALPEIDFDKIDTSTTFPANAGKLGKKVSYPFFISCMTGGLEKGTVINRNLAKAAQKYNIPMGVGSLRAALERPGLAKTFEIRKYAPDVPLMANVGLVQLNYGFGRNELQKCVDLIRADALVVHVNPIQEVIQPEGDRNFEHLLPKLERIVKNFPVPVIVKEVGFGLSKDVIERLYNIGIRTFDTAGWGGTNWAYTEGERRDGFSHLGRLFSDWGIPTTESVKYAAEVKKEKKAQDITILASGGVRTGIDVAKSLALGADLAGLAAPFGKAALESEQSVCELIETIAYELKIAMFGVGARGIQDLKQVKLQFIN